jgi:Cu2+-exporting ATPase
VFGFALLSGLLIWHILPFELALLGMAAVLVSACPCTLGLVTGLAVRVGMKKAADHQVELKSTQKLEEIDYIKHVIFDKNGTLTTIDPEVTEVFYAGDSCSYEDFLKYALMLEKGTKKAVGLAIYNHAAAEIPDIAADLPAIPLDTSNHSGVVSTLDGVQYVLGDQNMMNNHHISVESCSPQALDSDERVIYLARGETVLGYFILRRPLRSEAKDVVNALKKMGKEVYICTGSCEDVAMRYANDLGIPEKNVRFSMTSEDKVNYVRELQEGNKHRVAMIGDEENDADAIAASDFGVAMPVDGVGQMNREVADAEIRISSLEPLVSAFEISRQTGSNIRLNLIFSWIYNITMLIMPVVLLIFTGIVLSPGLCSALMVLQTSLVLLSTYLFKKQDLVCLKEAKAANESESGNDVQAAPVFTFSKDDIRYLKAMRAANSSYGVMQSLMPGQEPHVDQHVQGVVACNDSVPELLPLDCEEGASLANGLS